MSPALVNSADVFDSQELVTVMSQSENVTAVLEEGRSIQNWRDPVALKYYKLPGIRNLRDFVIVRSPETGAATMLVS